jgi:hypothetical protein
MVHPTEHLSDVSFEKALEDTLDSVPEDISKVTISSHANLGAVNLETLSHYQRDPASDNGPQNAIRLFESVELHQTTLYIRGYQTAYTDPRISLDFTKDLLVGLRTVSIPPSLHQMHSEPVLVRFASRHIHQWHHRELIATMTCGQDKMPRLTFKVYQFKPNGSTLSNQIQHRENPDSTQWAARRNRSPPLGMKVIIREDMIKYVQYVDEIINNHLNDFGDLCWKEEKNNFQTRLFGLITKTKLTHGIEASVSNTHFRVPLRSDFCRMNLPAICLASLSSLLSCRTLSPWLRSQRMTRSHACSFQKNTTTSTHPHAW